MTPSTTISSDDVVGIQSEGVGSGAPQADGLSPTVEPASSLAGSAASIPSAAHTPGPWIPSGSCVVANRNNRIGWVTILSCHTMRWWPGPAETESYANARLSAAAPELLDELVFMMGIFGEQLPDADHVRVKHTIAKARGDA